MTLGELFEIKYKEINNAAKLITRRRNIKQAPDLINTTYLSLFNGKNKAPKCPEQFLKWFCKSMSNQYSLTESTFNRSRSRAKELDFEIKFEHEEILSEVENYKAPTNLTTERARQYHSLMGFRRSLPPHEKIIFDLSYMNDLSARDIEKQLKHEGYTTSLRNVNNMVNEIKTKLEKWKTKHL